MKSYITTVGLFMVTSLATAQTFQAFVNRVAAAPEPERAAIVDSFMSAAPSFPLIEGETTAHFIYRGIASSVTVPGDANNWSTSTFPMTRLSTTDFWYRSQTFESDARLDYKFFLNGSTWILDPRNPRLVSGGFGPNSELRMPGYVPSPEIVFYPAIPHGTLRDTTFFSTNLNNSRTIRIYTPPDYNSSSDSFGVILFHDGLEYVTLAQAHNVLDYLIAENRIKPIIAVFVPPVNRTPEYAGNQMTQFSSFIVNELLPFIDGRYRTRREPAFRATLGASNGGNIALWVGLQYPNVFGNVAAQSSNIISSISTGFQNSPRLPLKLYLDLGTYDIPALMPLVRNFIPILQSKGYTYRYNEYHEGHSWGNWRAHIDNALEFFFPASPTAVRASNHIPDGFVLEQNYPNPFNPTTTIRFQIPDLGEPTFTYLAIFDLAGREVATLVHESLHPGRYEQKFSAAGLTSGIYFCRLSAGPYSAVRKFLVIK